MIESLSYSKLALFDRDLDTFYRKYILKEIVSTDTPETILGSAFDCLLTEGEEEFNKKYRILDVNIPTEMMGKYTESLINNYLFYISVGIPKEEAFNLSLDIAYNDSGFKLKKEAVEKRFQNEGLAYFKIKTENSDKIFLSAKDYSNISKAVFNLKTNIFTKDYFTPLPHVELLYQVVDTFMLDKYKCKVKLDLIKIDHEKKTIQPIDIKTTSDSPLSFVKSIRKFRYDIQDVLYSKYVAEKYAEYGYDIFPFKFIVINLEDSKNPICWQLSDTDRYYAAIGITKKGYTIRGVMGLIDDLEWHISSNNWEYKREVYLNSGVLTTNMYD